MDTPQEVPAKAHRTSPLTVIGALMLLLVGFNVLNGTVGAMAVFVGAIGLVLLAVGLLRRG